MRRGAVFVLILIGLEIQLDCTNAGETGRALSDDVSRPIYHSMAGIESSEDGIIELVEKVSEDPNNIRNCDGDGAGCGLAYFIVGCIIAGSIVFPILTFCCCCGFCIARTSTNCCGGCGGKRPSRHYEYPEVLLVFLLLLATMVILVAFSGLGYTAFSEMKGDYDNLMDAGIDLVRTPLAMVDDVNNTIQDIKAVGLGLFDNINLEFLILDEYTTLKNELNASLEVLKHEVLGLQMFIEGCDAATTSCTVPLSLPALPPHANTCGGGGGGGTTHPVGVGATVSNGNGNPTCENVYGNVSVACPCCTTCHEIVTDVTDVQSALPSDAAVEGLNQRIDTSEMDATIDEALGGWDEPLRQLEEAVAPVESFVSEAKRAVRKEHVDAIAAGLFLLTWVIVGCAIVAVLLSWSAGPQGETGAVFWWAGFVICVIYVTAVVCPMFGWLTAVAVPMESLCALLPSATTATMSTTTSGGRDDRGSEDLFRLLAALHADVDDRVETLVDGCVLNASGHLWPAAGVTQDTLFGDLDRQFSRETVIVDGDVTVTLDVSGQAAAFNRTAVDSLHPTDYGVVSVCPPEIAGTARCTEYLSDMAAYRSDLEQRIQRAQWAAGNVSAVILRMETLSVSTSSKIAEIKADASTAVTTITDMVWAVGSCRRIATAYEGLRSPLCEGVTAGIFGTWGALFVLGFFLYFLLFLVNKGAKIAFARRHPELVGPGPASGHVYPDEEEAGRGGKGKAKKRRRGKGKSKKEDVVKDDDEEEEEEEEEDTLRSREKKEEEEEEDGMGTPAPPSSPSFRPNRHDNAWVQ